MLYEEWKSRYKNLKNFNTVLQRCPRFWPLAPPRGMNSGVYSLGISEDPPRYLSSKFDASVRSDCWDISIWKTSTQCDGNGNANANANVDDRGDYNSSPCTSYRRVKNKQCRSRSVGFFRSQLIWIYTVCKARVYPGSAGQGLKERQFKWIPTRYAFIVCSICSSTALSTLLRSCQASLFLCVAVLRPSQPNGVMSSPVSLPNHTFTGQA